MDDLTSTRPWWRKKRWAAVFTLWLAGVYPLGYGPAFGYYWGTGDPAVGEAFDAVYGPIETLRHDGPEPVSAVVGWYLDLWMPEGWNEPIGCFGCILEEPLPDGPGGGMSAETSE